MRDVGDVYLQQPAAVLAPLNVHRVVEIARRLAVDRHNGQLAEIYPARSVGFRQWKRRPRRILQNLLREGMRKMVFANDDLSIDAQIPGTAQNFDNAANRSCASARIVQQLNVNNSSIELRDVRQAPVACRVFLGGRK